MTFRERLEQEYAGVNNQAANNNDPEFEGFDSDFFGIDNIKSYPACLDLRLSDGNRKAVPYSFIQEINFDPTYGIEITATTKKIIITGRDLGKLYDYLTSFRTRYIQTHLGTDANETGLFVEKINIEAV